jgi:hypothetical protein
MSASVPSVPRGIEVLLKKAAVDEAFKTVLLERPMAAAGAIGLKLGDTEATMLRAVPAAQLEDMVAHTEVPTAARPAFMGSDAAAMLRAATEHSHAYVIPSAVVGAIVDDWSKPTGWAILAGVVTAAVLPLLLVWRWIRRKRRKNR